MDSTKDPFRLNHVSGNYVRQGGRIIVQDVIDLPEGTEVRLELVEQDDDSDQLDAEDRVRLEAAIGKGRQEIADGKGIPAEQVVSELWAACHR